MIAWPGRNAIVLKYVTKNRSGRRQMYGKGRHMTIADGYKGYVLRLCRDRTARIIEIFGPACGDIALSTVTSVVAAKRWIDDYIDLEQTIADLIDRKKKLPEDSAEFQLIERELTGLRYSREEAGGIIEDLDPFGWGATCRPLDSTPATESQQVLPFRKSESPID
jgi:hypothetical protein